MPLAGRPHLTTDHEPSPTQTIGSWCSLRICQIPQNRPKLLQRRLEILHNLLRQHLRLGRVRRLFQGLVPDPERVQRCLAPLHTRHPHRQPQQLAPHPCRENESTQRPKARHRPKGQSSSSYIGRWLRTRSPYSACTRGRSASTKGSVVSIVHCLAFSSSSGASVILVCGRLTEIRDACL
jgi:hypothetical protein